MCGSDTFTTVVSSTSMKVPSITATEISQGLTKGCAREVSLLSLAMRYLMSTVGTTDIPGRNKC